MRRIEHTGKARKDIANAFSYLLERNPPAALRLKLRIARSVQLLAARPFLGRIRASLHPELRSFVVHPYILFYIPSSSGIRIIRFLHGARELDAILREDPND